MALNDLETEFARYAEMCYGNRKLSADQHREVKQAFFAGAWVLCTAMEEIGEPHISEQQGMDYMQARIDECKAFHSNIMRRGLSGFVQCDVVQGAADQ